MDTPTTEQILALLAGLQKGDHTALAWAAPTGAGPDQCAVAYLRVSSKKQLEGEGLSDQWVACVQAAHREGRHIIGLYVDPAISGRKEKRPALDRLKRDATARRFRAVLFFKTNRVGRNAKASYETAEELERHGLHVISATEYFRRGTAAGNLTFGMLVTYAQFGSDQLSEVMRARLTNKAASGRWVGPVPYGCRVENRILVADAGIVAVEQAWRLYATGRHSYTSVADALNEAGHRTRNGDRFGRESIRTILKNRAYAGWVASGGKEYPGLHGPLFPDAVELWAANQALMQQRHREGTTTNAKHKAESPAFLTGLLYCEHCGGKLWHHFGGRGGQFRYLICSGASRRTCAARQIRADALEAQALDLFGQLCFDEALIMRILTDARALIAGQNTPAERRIDPATIQAKLKRLALVYADEAIDEATYRAERDRLRALLAEAQAPDTAPTLHLNEQRALALLRAIPALLGCALTAERRQVAAAIACKLWVKDGAICGLSPRAELYPLLRAWAHIKTPPSTGEGGVSGGVPDGHPLPTVIPVILHSPDRVKVAA